jgi:hypothetical protein
MELTYAGCWRRSPSLASAPLEREAREVDSDASEERIAIGVAASHPDLKRQVARAIARNDGIIRKAIDFAHVYFMPAC